MTLPNADSALPVARTIEVRPGLRRACKAVRLATLAGLAALLPAALWTWQSPDRLLAAAGGVCPGAQAVTFDERAQLLCATLTLLPFGAGAFTLWQLWRLFGEYVAGRVFSPQAQRRLAGFAGGVLALAVAAPLLRALLVLALTIGNPPGQRLLQISVGSDDYVAILIGVALLAIAGVMRHAVRLAEEHAAFV